VKSYKSSAGAASRQIRRTLLLTKVKKVWYA